MIGVGYVLLALPAVARTGMNSPYLAGVDAGTGVQ